MKEYLKRQVNLLIILAGERIDPSLISLAGFHLVLLDQHYKAGGFPFCLCTFNSACAKNSCLLLLVDVFVLHNKPAEQR